ncbi:MAG TPA: M1 family aminopeptidase [Candidatus Acidoferrales bacterium]|nr:M1 family aminopeptidase [Candidatus Acidoferrales bacterium]
MKLRCGSFFRPLRSVIPMLGGGAMLLAACAVAICPSVRAQDASAVWSAMKQAPFDTGKYSAVEDVELNKDAIHINLKSGSIQFTQPANGVVYGAAFDGRGHITIEPPNAMEAQQLRRFTSKDALDMDFSNATFAFTDDTFDQLASKLHWSAAQGDDLASLYEKRQQTREDEGDEVVSRLFQGVFSADHKRTGYFLADLKTSDKGWIQVAMDALDPEAIQIGRLDQWTARTGVDTWMHFPAGNKTIEEAFRDPVGLQSFDVPLYEIDGTVTGGAEFSATTRVHVNEHFAGERVLRFDLDSNLRVSSVKDASGTALAFFQTRERGTRNNSYGDYVDVLLPQATAAGHADVIEFLYAGKNVVRKVGPGNYFCESELWYPTPDYPSGTNFNARSNFAMTFHAPKQFQLVATGEKTSEARTGNSVTTNWKSDKPLSVAGFAFGDYKVVTGDANDVKIEVYANKEPDDRLGAIQQMVDSSRTMSVGSLSPDVMAGQMTAEVANAVRLFEGYYGPAPYPRLAVTNIEYSYGQGWPMLLYLSSLSFLDPTQRHMIGIPMQEEARLTDFFRAHEVSHQWWGHRVAWKSYHDQWLSEGFAQFSGNLYVEYRRDWKSYLARLDADKMEMAGHDLRNKEFESAGPIWMGNRLSSSDSEGAYQVDVYDKGGYVLQMLRMMLFDPRAKDQDARFKAMMQDFTQTYDGKAASTEDFKTIAEKHMVPTMDIDGNRKLDWFFKQYVYGTGYAHYNFSTTIQPSNGKWDVTGTITRSGVPEDWKDILPFYAHISGRVIPIGWLLVRKDSETFNLTLPVKPDKVTVNDNDDILADVKQ